MNLPFVSIIIPMRNEINHIEQCLDSIISCDYPKDCYELIVVDGMSTDGSKEFVQSLQQKYENLKLVENPEKITPIAFNIGIKASKGDFICIISAHGYIEKKFLKNGLDFLMKNPDVDCVGGPAIATANNFIGKLIAIVTSSKFGTGSYFRYNLKDRYTDTVPFPIFRKDVFNRIGIYNEKLERNQDNEFNYRLRKAGGKIYFKSDVRAYVYVRSKLFSFIKYNFRSGKWNVFTNKICKHAFAIRHFIPLIFLLGIFLSFILANFNQIGKILFIIIFASYFIANLITTLKLSIKNGMKYCLFLPFIFFSLHITYGLGTLWALLINWKPENGTIIDALSKRV